jgi:hypothetical protein
MNNLKVNNCWLLKGEERIWLGGVTRYLLHPLFPARVTINLGEGDVQNFDFKDPESAHKFLDALDRALGLHESFSTIHLEP